MSGITCEKCKTGAMHATTTPRFSSALRFIGYSLLIPSIVLLLLTSGCAVVSCGSVASTAADAVQSSMTELRADIAAIDGLTEVQREAILKSEPANRETALATLTPAQRSQVESAYMSFAAKGTGAALGTAGAGLIGTVFFVATYVVLIPLLVLGFVLTLTKKVWQCTTCGYIYDRA